MRNGGDHFLETKFFNPKIEDISSRISLPSARSSDVLKDISLFQMGPLVFGNFNISLGAALGKSTIFLTGFPLPDVKGVTSSSGALLNCVSVLICASSTRNLAYLNSTNGNLIMSDNNTASNSAGQTLFGTVFYIARLD